MQRLSIDEVIEHCNRTCEMTEKIAKARGHELESIESKQFWEHYQVREWLEELKQYRAIGTIEEFKTLKEKSVAKKVISRNSMYRCPTCESLVSVTQTKCTKCSQKLDWE